jgi:hypothetical protein
MEWLGHKRRIGREVGEQSVILTRVATAIGDVPQFGEGKRADACCWTNIGIN